MHAKSRGTTAHAETRSSATTVAHAARRSLIRSLADPSQPTHLLVGRRALVQYLALRDRHTVRQLVAVDPTCPVFHLRAYTTRGGAACLLSTTTLLDAWKTAVLADPHAAAAVFALCYPGFVHPHQRFGPRRVPRLGLRLCRTCRRWIPKGQAVTRGECSRCHMRAWRAAHRQP